jgi:hypothetical protein
LCRISLPSAINRPTLLTAVAVPTLPSVIVHLPSTLHPPPATLHPPPATLHPPPPTLHPPRRSLTEICDDSKIRMCALENVGRTKGGRVRLLPRSDGSGARLRCVLVAAFVLQGLVWSAPASAASRICAAGPRDARTTHHCKCGARCPNPSSCCCPPQSNAATVSNDPIPLAPDSPEASSIPCLQSTPCSGPGLPASRTGIYSDGSVALSGVEPDASESAGKLLPPPSSDAAGESHQSRLDRPPERL